MRREFAAATKWKAFANASGKCVRCTAKLYPGNVEYDHEIPCEFNGDNSLSNCLVLCRSCHANKTFKSDIPAIAKAKRVAKRHAGIRKPRTITGWRKFDGTIVRQPRER